MYIPRVAPGDYHPSSVLKQNLECCKFNDDRDVEIVLTRRLIIQGMEWHRINKEYKNIAPHDKCFNCDKGYVHISVHTSFIMDRKHCAISHSAESDAVAKWSR